MYSLIFPAIALLVPLLIMLIDLGANLLDLRTTKLFVLLSIVAAEVMLGVIYYSYASLPD